MECSGLLPPSPPHVFPLQLLFPVLFVCLCCRECHCFGVFFWCSIFILRFLALTSVWEMDRKRGREMRRKAQACNFDRSILWLFLPWILRFLVATHLWIVYFCFLTCPVLLFLVGGVCVCIASCWGWNLGWFSHLLTNQLVLSARWWCEKLKHRIVFCHCRECKSFGCWAGGGRTAGTRLWFLWVKWRNRTAFVNGAQVVTTYIIPSFIRMRAVFSKSQPLMFFLLARISIVCKIVSKMHCFWRPDLHCWHGNEAMWLS